ncbi:hypothetical protein B296_00011817, partial [Ensete ventricosum]
ASSEVRCRYVTDSRYAGRRWRRPWQATVLPHTCRPPTGSSPAKMADVVSALDRTVAPFSPLSLTLLIPSHGIFLGCGCNRVKEAGRPWDSTAGMGIPHSILIPCSTEQDCVVLVYRLREHQRSTANGGRVEDRGGGRSVQYM